MAVFDYLKISNFNYITNQLRYDRTLILVNNT